MTRPFICPYCIGEYSLNSFVYLSVNIGSPDPRMLTHTCEKCGMPIRPVSNNRCISVVGTECAGKSTYITVMLHALSKTKRYELFAQNKQTRWIQNERAKELLTERRYIADGTGVPFPMIWCIGNRGKRKLAHPFGSKTITVYDYAGAEIEHLNASSAVGRYINTSEAIIFVIDPLTLGNKRKCAVEIVSNVVNSIRQMRGIGSGNKLNIPAAVVVAKFDVVLSSKSFADNAFVRGASLSTGDREVNMVELELVHKEIERWLSEIGEKPFVDSLKANFTDFCFFGVSALGSTPRTDGVLNEIRPHRVLDPILWLFKQANFAKFTDY
jgi:hypothetical protein